MEKRKKIAYWVITGLLCFCMLGGIGQLFQVKQIVDGFAPLGYPLYFFSIIGFWKTMRLSQKNEATSFLFIGFAIGANRC